jgi:outer membrane translocation and assembly module TamA
VVRRLYAGGADSVRGFAFQELGPPEAEDDAVGGTSLFEASVELRVPIWRDLSGVAFVDAGQLALEPFTWRPGDVRFAAGGGLRYKTPLGPIRFDVGRALESGRDVQFFFSVGHAF